MDESLNNFAITRNGDVRVTNWSPFKAQIQTPVTYSGYFDGSGDSLQVGSSNTGVTFGTADFTIEAWIYWNSLSSESGIMFGNSVGWTFYVFPANKLQWGKTSPQTPANLLTGNTTLNTGVWYHIAVTRASGTVTLWVNGVSDGTVADSANYSASGDLRVGISHGGQFFNGYMSNIRVVKGTAVYTANFTPPTTPLAATTGTSLLTCQSATFVDNSTNRFAITAAGNSQPVTINPFGSTFANSTGYTATEFGGSMYFDGTGDFVSVSNIGTTFTLNSDFTIEAWVYGAFPTGTNGVTIIDTRSAPLTAADWSLGVYGNLSGQGAAVNNGLGFIYSGVVLGTNIAVIPNQWNHVAASRSGTTLRMFVNGVQGFSGTVPGSIAKGAGSSAIIGMGADGVTYGNTSYISNLRFVKGQAVYTSNFVPPIAPLQPVPNTTLLLNGASSAITDATTKNVIETVGDVGISTAVSKFGGSSMFFDGSGDNLTIADNPTIELGSANFTIEGWFYWTANSGNWCLFNKSSSYELKSDSNRWVWQINANTNAFVTGWTPTLSTWYHIALVRNGATTSLYVDGSLYTSGSSTNASDNTSVLTIGSGAGGTFTGYIQDFRITQGVARYTATFTPPTSAFQIK
jgi:hypothetical protein